MSGSTHTSSGLRSPALSATSASSYDVLSASTTNSFQVRSEDSDDEIVWSISEGSLSAPPSENGNVDSAATGFASDDDFVVLSRPRSPKAPVTDALTPAAPSEADRIVHSELHLHTPVTASNMKSLEAQMKTPALAEAKAKAKEVRRAKRIEQRLAARKEQQTVGLRLSKAAANKAVKQERRKARREIKCAAMAQEAQEKGLTVAELKEAKRASMLEKKVARLEQEAFEKGVTLDELKEAKEVAKSEKKMAKRASNLERKVARLEQEAHEKGLTLDELKEAKEVAKLEKKKAKMEKRAAKIAENLESKGAKRAAAALAATTAYPSPAPSPKVLKSEPTAFVESAGLGARPAVDDISDRLSVVSGDNESVSGPSLYDEAATFISSFLSNPDAKNDSVCRLTLMQSLIIELGLASSSLSLPASLKSAKTVLKSRAFLNIREYIAVRGQGHEAVQQILYPSRKALIKDIQKKKNRMPLQWVKEHGLQVLLVGWMH